MRALEDDELALLIVDAVIARSRVVLLETQWSNDGYLDGGPPLRSGAPLEQIAELRRAADLARAAVHKKVDALIRKRGEGFARLALRAEALTKAKKNRG